MSTTDGLLDSILAVAQAASPLIGKVPEAIALGERVVELIDHAKETVDGDLPPPLASEREAIEQRINDHVDATAAKLRGDDQDVGTL